MLQRTSNVKRFREAALASALFALCNYWSYHAEAHTKITTLLTWSEDIRPIFRQKCMQCHSPGGIAPPIVDLTTYGGKPGQAGARDWAKAIEEEILTGRMPPWQADKRFGQFLNERSLTKQETDAIIAWIQGGAPQGLQRDLPAPEEFINRDWLLGKPDLEIMMPREALIPKGTREGSFRFEFKAPETFGLDANGKPLTEQWITGYEFLPGNAPVVHTMRATIRPPEGLPEEFIEMEVQREYDPLEDEKTEEHKTLRKLPSEPQFLGQWIRGDSPVLYPDDAGRRMKGGSTIELEISYKKQGIEDTREEARDQSRLGLYFSKEPVDLLVESKPIANMTFESPGGEAYQEVNGLLTFAENAHLIGIYPQLGELAADLEVRALYPDGKIQSLLWIGDYKRKWESSYIFETPLEAKAGTSLQMIAHFDNSGDPAVKAKRLAERQAGHAGDANSAGKTQARRSGEKSERPAATQTLAGWVDYFLDAHMIVATPTPTPAPPPISQQSGMVFTSEITQQTLLDFSGLGPKKEGEGAAAEPAAAAPEKKDLASAPPDQGTLAKPVDGPIYWCPMRGPLEGQCGLKDYHSPGKCEVCEMPLVTKDEYLSKLDRSQTATKKKENWELKKETFEPVYWCPNRGQEGHQLKEYTSPGRCEVCSAILLHYTLFKPVHTYMCLTPDCPSEYKALQAENVTFYSPGLCPDCGQPVQSMGHMDHTPVHGGQLFMADNLYHHLEGTLPAPDEFRLYFYDDYKKPLDPRNFSGKVVFSQYDEKTDTTATQEYPLNYGRMEDEFLTGKIPPVMKYPVEFKAVVWLAGVQKGYDFVFDEPTKEPPPDQAAGPLRAHMHVVRPPVVIPEAAADVVREIARRDQMISNLIKNKSWFDLHIPAFDAKDFADGLKPKLQGLDARTRGRVYDAIGKISQGAILLDRYGDAADETRVGKGYEIFGEGVKELKAVFPEGGK